MGIGQKVKEVAHKMGVGGHSEEGPHTSAAGATGAAYRDVVYTGAGATGTGSAYQNVGATYGAQGTSGIAGPVAPASGPLETGMGGEGYRQEGAYGTETRTNTAGMPVVQQTATTTGAGTGPACGTETFTKVEDRPVVKERVEQVVEHRPVEKEFMVETRAVGERDVGVGQVEHLGTSERVVGEGPKYS